MKKLLSLILAVIIAVSSAVVSVPAFAKSESKNETVIVQTLGSSKKKVNTKKMKKAYKKKVDKLIKKHGKSKVTAAEYDVDEMRTLSYCVVGISFLKLVDMNGDGVKELLVAYAVPTELCGISGACVEYRVAVYTFNGKKAIRAGGYKIATESWGQAEAVRIVNVSKKEKCLYIPGSSSPSVFYKFNSKKLKKFKAKCLGGGYWSIGNKKMDADEYNANKYIVASLDYSKVSEYQLTGMTKSKAKKLVKHNNKVYKSLKDRSKKKSGWGTIKNLKTAGYNVDDSGSGFVAFTFDFSMVKDADGYEIAHCWNSFDKVDIKLKVKSNKLYYCGQDYAMGIKIRSYKTKNGKKIYGKWKKIRIEKSLDRNLKQINYSEYYKTVIKNRKSIN